MLLTRIRKARRSSCMRAAYVSVLMTGLAYSEIVWSQGTASFGTPDRAAIEQLFDRYAAAFFSKDYVKLREYVQAPFVRFGPSNTRPEAVPTDWVVLPTVDET